MSLETLITDLAQYHLKFEEVPTGEEDVKSYILANPPIIFTIQLNVCEQYVDLYVSGKSIYYQPYNDLTVQDIAKILEGYVT